MQNLFHMENLWFLDTNPLFSDGNPVLGQKICGFCAHNPQFLDGKSAVFGWKSTVFGWKICSFQVKWS